MSHVPAGKGSLVLEPLASFPADWRLTAANQQAVQKCCMLTKHSVGAGTASGARRGMIAAVWWHAFALNPYLDCAGRPFLWRVCHVALYVTEPLMFNQ
jgi:hypothetical protein